ncbi:nascent polypeptide-associated complex subunit alpha, muscle-specific form-like [Rissa tridactyla]|uniref:nascent polypeptide-associated complex subunit alpha, muscle-specific form-like n=1 Tax=Rissa tridactyla TaxID=75485 RepID=UPI0023BA4D35|nr:nascent polypeptide-associated complex subunit alpha, muscle-specific form-like [Rissa tridactyla]
MKEIAVGKTVTGSRKPELVADFARKFLAGRKKLGLVSPERDRKSVGFSSSSEEDDDEDNCEPPTMSFEEYLTYDQPQKKKQAVKPSASPGQKDHWHSTCLPCQDGLDSACLSAKSPSLKRTNEKRAEEEPPEAPEPKRILLDVDIKLPDIPLPPIQASCSPPPPVESAPRSQRKRKAPALTPEESEEGLSCYRQNSKTLVRPGPKTAPVPQTVPPPPQSTRLLTNSIDSLHCSPLHSRSQALSLVERERDKYSAFCFSLAICEVSGVPFSVLEPVLERCTPEQLHLIEERNHALIESTDRLWHIHCLRDFKNEKPEASESWREMYLRLHEAREQRLLMLSRKIGSAHSNKGQAAKTVFLASPPKAPRDVRRRQKKFGTGGPLVPEKTKIKAVLCAASKSHARGSEEKFYDGPSTSSAHSVPPSATTFSSCDPRKPPVKSQAAKTVFLASPPKAPRDVRRRQKKFGTGGPLVPEKTKIKAVLCAASKSHARGSEEKFYDGPSTSSAHSVPPSATTFSSCDPRKPPVKSQAAKTVFLASPPKAPRDVRRRQKKFGTGGPLVPEKTKIKAVLCAASKSHARGSEEKFYDGPSTSSAHSVPPSATTFSSCDPRKPPVKSQAAKTVFLASPPKAPRDVRRRQKKFGTGGPLVPEKTKIKAVLCAASKSHARGSEEKFYDGPSTSSAHSVPPSATTFSSCDPRKPPVKSQAAKTVFLASPPKAPRDVRRRQKKFGTGGPLVPEKTKIKAVLCAASKSHARGSEEKFYDGPSTSSAHSVPPSATTFSSCDPRKPPVKSQAAKTVFLASPPKAPRDVRRRQKKFGTGGPLVPEKTKIKAVLCAASKSHARGSEEKFYDGPSTSSAHSVPPSATTFSSCDPRKPPVKSQAAKTVFLASPPKAPRDVRRRQKKFGTGGPLVPEKTKIKAVLCAASKSHARGSEEKFYDGPSTSSAHSVPPSATTFSSCDPRKPPVKSQAAKTVFLASPPKAPRDVRRRQKKFGTGGPLVPEKTKIKAVLCAASKSHARGSEEKFYDGPSTSSAHSVPPSATTFSSCDPRKPPVKSQAAKTVFLASPPKAPRDVRRRQKKFGTGGPLVPEKTKIKAVLCAASKSHARGSEEKFYDGPSTSSAHSVPPSATTFSSCDPRKPPVKSQTAKTVFLDSPSKAPQNEERRQERSGTGRALLPEKTDKSHARGSGGKSHDGPSTSTPHSVPSLGRTMFSSWFPEPKKPPAKKIAPIMAKAVKDFKTRFSR